MPYLRLYDTNGRMRGHTQIEWEPAIKYRKHWWQLRIPKLPVSYPLRTVADAVFAPVPQGYYLTYFGIEIPGFGEVKVMAPWMYVPAGRPVTIAKGWEMTIT